MVLSCGVVVVVVYVDVVVPGKGEILPQKRLDSLSRLPNEPPRRH